MTTCQQVRDYIQRSVSGDLPATELWALEQHVANCHTCASRLRWEGRIHRELGRHGIPEPSPDYESRVLAAATGRHAVAGGSGNSSKWTAAVAGGAIAASLALGLFLGGGGIQSLESPVTLADSSAERVKGDSVQNETPWVREQTVKLAFSANSALDDVSLTLELPANVELARFPGHRELTWQVSLKPGDNIIALPLRIAYPEAGELVAHLDDGNKRKTFRAQIPGIGTVDQEPSS